MSARPETLARLGAWLSDERIVEDRLAQLRDLLCDVVWAGDDMHRTTEALDGPARDAWRSVGGQQALEAFDNIAREITDLMGDR